MRHHTKKKSLRAEETDSARISDARDRFAELQQVLDVEDLVFLDQAGVNTSMTRTHARSPRGTRAKSTKPGRHAKNTTVLGALGIEGMLACSTVEGGMKKADFLEFLEHDLFPQMTSGQAVVLDNLRHHHSKEARALAKRFGIFLIYIPPYSPEFNPIEHAWSKLKAVLRKIGARTQDALMAALATGITLISPADVLGWTEHCGYLVPPGQPA